MKTGVVKYFNDDKGFGFIVQDDGGPDIFAHRNNLSGNPLKEGDRVTYEAGVDDRNGKPCAVNIAGGTGCGCGLNFEPTVVSGATKEMDAYREEVFGPVAFVYGFETEAEVLASCNDDTEAGLAAYVFTRDTDRLWRFAASMEAGMVGANTTDVTAEYLPFGGIKQSGYGKEGGTDCILEFSEKRVLCIGR